MLVIFWLVLYGFLVKRIESNCYGAISSSDYNALQALYYSTDGKHWNWERAAANSTIWTFPSDFIVPCSQQWQGLICIEDSTNSTQCNIVEVNLLNFNLKGFIPTEIGNLDSIQILNLGENHILGSIPSELGELVTVHKLELNDNSLTGSIPSELGLLVQMEQLVLNNNNLTSSIPSELGQMSAIVKLLLNNNCLHSTIPTELGLLIGIQDLIVSENKITGSIPTELGQLKEMIELEMNNNQLNGTLPTQLGQLATMQILTLNNNFLTGSIPTIFGQLHGLEILYLYTNGLNGTIPTDIGQLPNLQKLDLNSNFLSGFIPSEIGNISTLKLLSLEYNAVDGPLPTELGQLLSLESLTLCCNMLTGSIPSEYGLLESAVLINLNSNYLVGSMPTEFGLLSVIEQIIVNNNGLMGPIPTQLGLLTRVFQLFFSNNLFNDEIPSELGLLGALQQVNLDYNRLSGSIPTQLGQLLVIQLLSLNNNQLVGPIPTEMAHLTSLRQLFLQFNFFSGTLSVLDQFHALQVVNASVNMFSGALPSFPAAVEYVGLFSNYFSTSIGEAFALTSGIEYIDISNNLLSSSIPSYFSSFRMLQSLNVSYNLLTQSIDSLIVDGGYGLVQSIDVSNNMLSGTLSTSFFMQRQLRMVLLYENCFSGSIPSSICSNKMMESLFLDSLTGNCGSLVPRGLHSIIQAALPRRLMSGSIPLCIWEMSQLQLLRLSGNGLTGSLGAIPGNSSLSVVVLSSNVLTGSIPSSWQTSGQWTQLDLSSNKLSGTLSDQYAMSSDSTLLDLTVNRLSGRLPTVFQNVSYPVNVLNGNLFQCQTHTIPQQDPDHDGYVCGSDDFNVSLEFAVAAIGCVCLLVGYIVRYKAWIRLSMEADTKTVTHVGKDAYHIMLIASVQFVVTIVLYSVFKMVNETQEFSTHTTQYTWVTTAAFMHGWAPVLTICLVLFISSLMWKYFHISDNKVVINANVDKNNYWETCRRILKVVAAHTINVVIIIAVNASYVNAVLEGLSIQKLFAIQFVLSLFKLGWNAIAVPFLVRSGKCTPSDQLFMTLFSFIGGPFISTFFTSSNCFRDLFVGKPAVQSTAAIVDYTCNDSCVTACTDLICITSCVTPCSFSDSETLSIVLTPPWNYSYQCSSSLLQIYIPVMIVTFAISGAVVPLLEFAYYLLPQNAMTSIVSLFPKSIIKSLFIGTTYAVDQESARQFTERKNMFPLQTSTIMLSLSVFLSFGIASPLLSILIALGELMQFVRLSLGLGRLQSLLDDDAFTRDCLREVVNGMEMSWNDSQYRIVLMFTAVFWGFLVFDMIGDVFGSIVGAAAILAPVGICFVIGYLQEINALMKWATGVSRSHILKQLSVVMGMEMADAKQLSHQQTIVSHPQDTKDNFRINESLLSSDIYTKV